MVAPSATFEYSLAEIAISKRECFTKYNIPTPDLNLVCWSGESHISPLSGRLMMVLGGAGVSSFNDSMSAPK
jgi:hypothetical protein